jgi:hypothetical protein
MLMIPPGIWCENHDAHYLPNNIVRFLRFEKGPVATVVKNDENPDQKTRCQHGKKQCINVRVLKTAIHGIV